MEVPPHILEKLKCDNCREYLSSCPVYLKNNGFTFCGRCYSLNTKEPANRMLQYEAVAQLLKFPCKYTENGCKETVSFTENYQDSLHEQWCEFRNFSCPIIEAEDCNWAGQRKNILGHFQSSHPGHIVKNPCQLRYDMATFSMKTYIMNCFGLLFLLYTKVCIASGKIYHAVKLLDNPQRVSDFKFTLDITRDDLIISRPGKVVSQNCDDENSAIVTNISSLLDFLNGVSGTVFTVKVQKVVEEVLAPILPVPQRRTNVEQIELLGQWIRSTSTLSLASTSTVSSPSTSTVSSPLIIKDRFCRYKSRGCSFKDSEIKCEKHEELFCSLRNWCWICWSPPPNQVANKNSWDQHTIEHKGLTYDGKSMFHILPTEEGRTLLVKTQLSLVFCRYILTDSEFKLYIWSNAGTTSIKNCKCVVKIISIDTSLCTKEFVVTHAPKKYWDWYIRVEKVKSKIQDWNINNFNIDVKITRLK